MPGKKWNLVVSESYTGRDGKEKRKWHNIATCFENEKGTIRISLPPGVSISGSSLFLFPPREGHATNASAEDEEPPF